MAASESKGGIGAHAAASADETSDFLKCPVCKREYTDPVILPCLHTYCRHCLASTLPQGDLGRALPFKCSVCKHEVIMPADKVEEGFKRNYYVEGVLNNKSPASGQRKCVVCEIVKKGGEVNDASSKCISCQDYLCSQCAVYHCATKLTRDHKILTFQQLGLAEYQKEIQANQAIPCATHTDQLLKYYCLPCQTPICRDCKALDHDDHKSLSLPAAFEVIKPKLLHKVEDLERRHDNENEKVARLTEMAAELEESKKKIQAIIHQRAEGLRKIVLFRENQLLEEIDNEACKQQAILAASRDHHHGNHTLLADVLQIIKNILQQGSPLEVLLLKPELSQRLDNLQDTSFDDSLPNQPQFKLKTSQEFETNLKTGMAFGKVEIDWEEVQVPMQPPPSPKLQAKAECILEFDSGCNFQTGISVSPDNEYVIVNENPGKLCIFTSQGKLKKEIVDISGTPLKNPIGICHLPNGTTVVTDIGNNAVMSLTSQWEQQQSLDIHSPQGVALNLNNHIAIAQHAEKCISIFSVDTEGLLTKTATIKENKSREIFAGPYSVAYMSTGDLVVGDLSQIQVHILSYAGEPKHAYTVLGPDNNKGQPYGVCADRYNNIFVADHNNHCIHVVSAEGNFVKYLVTRDDDLRHPWALAINHDGDLVVTQEEGKVKVFRYLEK
ncbi:tripartite motif-containing protein 3 [Lingula anatina]|uniref:Tripartite motif-containing protein 3 n=1 Tax=Lingula anatina TaxID=7574 RepID=A0A1S3HRW4_LINAN|nr:tripartite motif-containing protein 3 [Lingula anatina]|eukprot:XP_013388286.1 tripartite motif-containing protein 3 [Lingula anatina]